MIFTVWHSILGMEKHTLAWHKDDMADETREYEAARGFMERWSEISDIVYTYTRAKWSGHSALAFPLPRRYFFWGALYMFPKYTLRWLFFVTAGRLAGSPQIIRAVRNPQKSEKLKDIADQYHLNAERFCAICRKLLKYWILLK